MDSNNKIDLKRSEILKLHYQELIMPPPPTPKNIWMNLFLLTEESQPENLNLYVPPKIAKKHTEKQELSTFDSMYTGHFFFNNIKFYSV